MNRRMRLLAKEFFHNPFFDALLLCALGYLFISADDVGSAVVADESLASYARTGLSIGAGFLAKCTFLGLALFLLLSYEFTGRCRTFSLYETIDSHACGASRTLWAQLRLLLLLALAFWLCVALLCWRILWVLELTHTPLPANFLLASVLYGFFPALIGVLMGAVWQKFAGRAPFYGFLLFSAFFATRMSDAAYTYLAYYLYHAAGMQSAFLLQRLLDFWRRLMPIYNAGFDPSYGIGIEPFHWALILAWCLLALGLLFAAARGKWRKTIAFICFAGCLFSSFLFWQRGSNWSEYNPPALYRWGIENQYYDAHPFTEDDIEPANFCVVSCEMDFSVFFRLNANVRLTLDGTYQESYDFTLYHDFQISKITDASGKCLDFTRDGDYVTVQNHDTAPITELRFFYCGWRENSASSAQGIFLPGYFAYYPQEGRQLVYAGNGIYARGTVLPQREFSVKINCLCPVFTNLTTDKENTFSGTASSITILGGQYQESYINGIRYILPWSVEAEDWVGEASKLIASLRADWALDISAPMYETAFLTEAVGEGWDCIDRESELFFLGHYDKPTPAETVYAHLERMLASVPDSSYVKQWFLTLMQDILQGDETARSSLDLTFGAEVPQQWHAIDSFSDRENAYRQIGWYIYHAIDQGTAQEVVQKLYDYLAAGGGDDLAFVRSLEG